MSTWNIEFKNPIDFLALESALSDLLLLESGDQIVLEQTGTGATTWTYLTKN